METIQTLNKWGFMQQADSFVYILLGIHSKQRVVEAFQSFGVQEFTTKPLSEPTVMEACHKYWGGDTDKQHI
jgi:response regulator RpfG family c-di-GMP phosphodiesterase